MSNININLRGFDPQVYENWLNGAYTWHCGIKNGTPFIEKDVIDINVDIDGQLKLKL